MIKRRIFTFLIFIIGLFIPSCNNVSQLELNDPELVPPENVAAVPADARISLSWDMDSIGKSYNIYWQIGPGVTKNANIIPSKTSPFIHEGLLNDTTYYYRIATVMAGDEGWLSEEAYATPFEDLTVPAIPQNVKARAGNMKVTLSCDTQPNVSYKIYWSLSTGVSMNDSAITTATMPYTHTGLINTATYFYKISAVNASGESKLSSEGSAMPDDIPDPPDTLSATPGDRQVTLAWNSVPLVSSYNIYWALHANVTKTDNKITAAANPCIHDSLYNDSTYYYRIASVNSLGREGDLSDEVSATPFDTILPPVITQHPQNQSVIVGQTATFSVTATGTGLLYQWQKNGVAISGAAASVYTTPATTLADSNTTFRCIVSNSLGSDTSNAAILKVSQTLVPPNITKHPLSKALTVGQTATFSVTATGTGLLYQWQKNNANITGATDTSHTIASVTMADSNTTYRCIASNGMGSDTSNSALLVVTQLNLPPEITQHPQNKTVNAGQTATFSVTATGPSLLYQWQKNASNISAATDSVYTTPVTTLADSNTNFRCIVSNSMGSDTSNYAVLKVTQGILPPEITQHPQNKTVTVGQTASFSVSAMGTSLAYQWQKNDSAIAGATASSYTTPATTMADSNATFRCVVSNPVGSMASNRAVLTVTSGITPPVITQHPQNVSVKVGESASFTVGATGGSLKYQWQKNGTNISGATGTTYTKTSVTIADNNTTYRCVVSNTAGSIACEAALLTVTSAPATVTVNPQSQAIGVGQTATFWVGAIGTNVQYQWQKNNSNISGAIDSVYTTSAATLADNNTTYRCIVSNIMGSDTSNFATLTVSITTVQAAAGGYTHTMIIKTDGTLWGCGYNRDGSLGLGDTVTRTRPEQVTSGVKSVAAGYSHTLIVKTDNTLWACGYNNSGGLGDGSYTRRLTPVQVMTNVRSAAAGLGYSMIVKNDSTLWATGLNDYGQLGRGNTSSINTPVQIMSGVKSVAIRYRHTLIVKGDGTLWVCGFNYWGQVGVGDTIDRHTPEQVLTDVKAASAGNGYSLALKNDGTLWGFGFNGTGQLCNANGGNQLTPAQIMTGVESVKAGHYFTMILKTGGTYQVCGVNDCGQLGTGDYTTLTTPVTILTNIQNIAAGRFHSLVIKADKTILVCGSNHSGELGIGTTPEYSTILVPVFQ